MAAPFYIPTSKAWQFQFLHILTPPAIFLFFLKVIDTLMGVNLFSFFITKVLREWYPRVVISCTFKDVALVWMWLRMSWGPGLEVTPLVWGSSNFVGLLVLRGQAGGHPALRETGIWKASAVLRTQGQVFLLVTKGCPPGSCLYSCAHKLTYFRLGPEGRRVEGPLAPQLRA